MSRICLHLGRVVIRIHISALVMAGYMILLGYGDLFCIAYSSILLHEAAHAAASALLGHMPGEIELTPLGAMLNLREFAGIQPFRRVCILLAGPMITLALCHLAVVLTQLGWLHAGFGKMLFTCNIGILVLNLLPCLPLDGGNLLALLLGFFLPAKVCSALFRIIGSICGTSLNLLALAAAWQGRGLNISMLIIGCFLIYAAQTCTASAMLNQLRRLMDRKAHMERKGIIPSCTIAVMADQPVIHLLSRQPFGRYVTFIVLEIGTLRWLGMLPEEAVISHSLGETALTAGELLDEQQRKSAKLHMTGNQIP